MCLCQTLSVTSCPGTMFKEKSFKRLVCGLLLLALHHRSLLVCNKPCAPSWSITTSNTYIHPSINLLDVHVSSVANPGSPSFGIVPPSLSVFWMKSFRRIELISLFNCLARLERATPCLIMQVRSSFSRSSFSWSSSGKSVLFGLAKRASTGMFDND